MRDTIEHLYGICLDSPTQLENSMRKGETMKRVTNAILPIRIKNVLLSDIRKCLFKFKQDEREIIFTYPSDRVVVISEDIVGLKWTVEETEMFNSQQKVAFDTMIWLTGTDQNPETNVSYFYMMPSLFTKEEVESNA